MNISSIKDCYGCGVCATVCPMNIIEISLNSEGFYEPRIRETNKCTDCNLCMDVCSYSKNNLALEKTEIKSYAGWSRDDLVRRKCSSGGIGFELERALIERDYKVCVVRYNPDMNCAEHYIATTVEQLLPSIGSKYIQSYTTNGFKAINRAHKHLVIGTPCQIDSFRRYIQKFKKEDNFILMDFFCHGVPSMLMWNKYLTEVEKITDKVTYVSWRNKDAGWHDSYNLLIKGKEKIYSSRLSQGDTFYRLFLSDTCLGKACYEKCKFKCTESAADIRIGDLWGFKYRNNKEGVSGVLTFTRRGDELLHSISSLHIEPCSLRIVAEGQMKNAPKMPSIRRNIMEMLRNDSIQLNDIILLVNPFLKKQKIKVFLKHPLRVVKNRLVRYFKL
jgi:coenzyme F420-reducing hydrogenase beta subunit